MDPSCPNLWRFYQTNSRFLSPLWAHETLESIRKHVCIFFPSWTGSCCLRGISHKWVACSRLSRGRRTKLGNTCRLPGPLASGKELRLDFHRHRPYNPFPPPRQALLLLRAFHPQWSFHLHVFLIENMKMMIVKIMVLKKEHDKDTKIKMISLPFFSGFVPSSLTSTRKCLFLGAELELCTNR